MTRTTQDSNVPMQYLGALLAGGALLVFALLTRSNEILGTDAFGRSLTTFIGITAFGVGTSLLVASINKDDALKNLLGAATSVILVGALGILATILIHVGILPLTF